MRVTHNMLYNGLRRHLETHAGRLLRAQEAVATQKRLNRLSDDPVDAGRVLDLKSAVSRAGQYLRNINHLQSLANIQDSSLGQVHELVSRAKELLVQEANEVTSTSDTREATRVEIAMLTGQLVQIANTRIGGEYIYSGSATDTPAFADAGVTATPGVVTGGAVVTSQAVIDATAMSYDDFQIVFTAPGAFDVVNTTTGSTLLTGQGYTSGNPIQFDGLEVVITDSTGPPAAGDTFDVITTRPGQYQGNDQVVEVEIQPGMRVKKNIPGSQVFQGQGLPGGVDLFVILNDLNEALRRNDRTAMDTLLGRLDSGRGQVSNTQAGVGARVNLIDDVEQQQTDVKTNLEILQSDLEDIDLSEAIIELSKQQNLLEATLGAGASIVQPSLLDFLR